MKKKKEPLRCVSFIYENQILVKLKCVVLASIIVFSFIILHKVILPQMTLSSSSN